jgi:hypothetical protein
MLLSRKLPSFLSFEKYKVSATVVAAREHKHIGSVRDKRPEEECQPSICATSTARTGR